MDDLEARVAKLEDELGILKGEIKSVLMEVRTALLAQGNPFTNQSIALPVAAPVAAVTPPAPAPVEIKPEPIFESVAVAMKPSPSQTLTAVEAPAPQTKNFSMNTLAMLMAWTQGNMARLSLEEMSSLLSLARYGDVIDAELEVILSHIANHFDQAESYEATARGKDIVSQRHPATISEYLLALHELNSVLNEQDESALRWLRQIA